MLRFQLLRFQLLRFQLLRFGVFHGNVHLDLFSISVVVGQSGINLRQ
jgi:hypothetical protein